VTADNLRYLTTKRDRMGHDLPGLPRLDDEVTEASADALPAQVRERAGRLEPAAIRSALRLARALSPFAVPAVDGDDIERAMHDELATVNGDGTAQ